MAFKGRPKPGVDFSDLLVSLINSKLQTSNFPLYQTIAQLINRTQQSVGQVNQTLNSFVGDITIGDDADLAAIVNSIATINAFLNDGTFLTAADEQFSLPSSRQLMPGLAISFDDTVVFQRIINAAVDGITIQINGLNQLEVIGSAVSGDYVVVSDGGIPTPLPMDDGFGNFMYILYSP